MADQQQQGQRQIQIKITDEVMKGVPSNMMAVSHSREEFVLDFMNIIPPQGQGIVTSRVVVTPGHMKRIVAALKENIERYEKQFGKIANTPSPQDEIGFRVV
ncbi:MAG: DUF3467 domain-containing protein [Candidatus Kerfeldbacteria bacterium]|nr:DUF3467 domain-containing protein [Candidatus Kerfeldbacteria bacterium]